MKEFLENLIEKLSECIEALEIYDSEGAYEVIKPIYEEAKELYKSPEVN